MPEPKLAKRYEDAADVLTLDFTKPAAPKSADPLKRDRSHLKRVDASDAHAYVQSPVEKLQADLRTQLTMPFPDPSPEPSKIPTVYTVTGLVVFCGLAWTMIIMGIMKLF